MYIVECGKGLSASCGQEHIHAYHHFFLILGESTKSCAISTWNFFLTCSFLPDFHIFVQEKIKEKKLKQDLFSREKITFRKKWEEFHLRSTDSRTDDLRGEYVSAGCSASQAQVMPLSAAEGRNLMVDVDVMRPVDPVWSSSWRESEEKIKK